MDNLLSVNERFNTKLTSENSPTALMQWCSMCPCKKLRF